MYFLYVDESGDSGGIGGSSSHFILCGLLVHHSDWHVVWRDAKDMRGRLTRQFGLPAEAELHASDFLSKNSDQFRLSLNSRFQCALHAIGFIGKHRGIVPLRVVVAKSDSLAEPAYTIAWHELVRTAQERIAKHTQACPSTGLIVICDDHRTAPKQDLVGPIVSRHPGAIIDLPFGLDSKDSDLLQLADLSAFLTKQTIQPSKAFQGRRGAPLLRRNDALYAEHQ
jgi:hypothetical protein